MAPLPLQNPDVPKNRQGGICHFLNLQEDNIRFILLAIFLYVYLAMGAFVFQAIEESGENKMRKDFQTLYDEFIRNFTHCYSTSDLPDHLPEKDDQGMNVNAFKEESIDKSLRIFSFAKAATDLIGESSDGGGTAGGASTSTTTAGDAIRTSHNQIVQVRPSKAHYEEGAENHMEVDDEDGNLFVSGLVRGKSSASKPFTVTLDGLHELLFAYGNATQAGIVWNRKRWDWVGSFHFAWTIVSTIGYGATTPATTIGKLLIIPYGFIGCAGGLLFFNLFLERIITFLATCMRSYRLKRQKRRPCIDSDFIAEREAANKTKGIAAASLSTVTVAAAAARRGASPSRSSAGDEESVVEQPDWKPSVYWVMLCLFIMSVIVICASGAMFQTMEGWTFGEALYFSFVSYATIGLGDYVSLQRPNYGQFETAYRVVAFILMVFGCCCIYSLLNVTSIVIKQLLNYIIKRMDYCGECCCCTYCRCSAAKVKRRISTKRRRGQRSFRNTRNGPGGGGRRDRCQISVLNNSSSSRAVGLGHHPYDYSGGDNDMNDEGGTGEICGSRFDLDERRCSGENMISIRGELSNKVSLAVMQKRLYETAQMSRHSSSYDYPGSFSATSVGPLAIVTEKLGDNPG